MFALAAFYGHIKPFLRYIFQSYTQSESSLERDVYISPPKERVMPENVVLKIEKRLYRITESDLHW